MKTYGHAKPMDQWKVFIKDHHDGYITLDEFERNQEQLAKNAFAKAGGSKSGRGGRALLVGLLTCARCGRRLKIAYTGRGAGSPKYRCDQPNSQLGRSRCMAFGTWVADRAVVGAALKALEPVALEASMRAEQLKAQHQADRRRIAELDIKQARYDALLAERRFAGCDPDNRLVAEQLERAWEDALRRVEQLEKTATADTPVERIAQAALGDLADDLQAAWDSPTTSTSTRQRLIRALVEDIVVDLDEAAHEVELVIHWKGGRHTRLRVPKPRSGEHRRRASEEVFAVVRSMAGRWNDEHIAASLNRMGLRTGQGKTWTAIRVGAFRGTHDIPAHRSGQGDGNWLTMSEAARELGVTNHVIRHLIHDGDLPAVQVIANAPYQIRAEDLRTEGVHKALQRRGRPRRAVPAEQTVLFQVLEQGVHNDQ